MSSLSECFRQEEEYSEPHQKSKIEPFVKVVLGFRRLSIFLKSSNLDAGLGSEYTCADSDPLLISSKNNEAADLLAK